ncbi:MAG: two-component regulator propeller domain-containing protein [Bacteroidota bacterium]|nr:two-component regulator propeller domain-containing protein [Bacteroidota bacterium]
MKRKFSACFILLTVSLAIMSQSSFAQSAIDLCTEWRDFTQIASSTCLALDGKYVWVGTSAGLIRFDTTTNTHETFLKTNSGVGVNSIASMVRDRSGAMWFGTWGGGLAKYSNGNWTAYTTMNQALPSNYILSLCLDSTGKIWIGTSGGVGIFDGSTFTVMPIPNLPSAYKNIYCLATDPSGNVWIGVAAGNNYGALVKYDGTNWTSYTPQNSTIVDAYVNSLACAADGSIWIGFADNIIQNFDGTSFTGYSVQPGIAGGYGSINTVAIGSDGGIWIGDYLGTGEFIDDKWNVFGVGGTGGIAIGNGVIWIATDGGLVKMHGSTWDSYTNFSNSSLTSNQMEAALTVDQKGNTLAAVFSNTQEASNTIASFDGKNWTTITPPLDPTNMSRPISLAADSLGNLWIGMMDIGLVRFDGANWDVFDDTNSALITNRVKCITYDKRSKKIWAGTYLSQNGKGSGCAAFDGKAWKGYSGPDMGFPGYAEINQIAIDTAGNVWVGAAYQGVSRFDGNAWQLFTTKNSGMPDDFVTSVAADTDGSVWIGTTGGVAHYSNGSWTVFNTSNSLLQWDDVTALSIDSRDRIWIGTFGHGAALFDHGKWTIYDQWNSGLSNYNIKAIVTDSHDHTWFAMEYAGLAEYSPTGFDDIPKLFAFDTVSNCDMPGVNSIELTGDGCQGRKIVAQHITGDDSAYYRIIHRAINPVTQDSVEVQFFPDTERSYHAMLEIELEDGARYDIPLSGFGEGNAPLVLSSIGQFNDTIGGGVDLPIVISHSALLSSAEIVLHYDTTMLIYQGSTLRSGLRADMNG